MPECFKIVAFWRKKALNQLAILSCCALYCDVIQKQYANCWHTAFVVVIVWITLWVTGDYSWLSVTRRKSVMVTLCFFRMSFTSSLLSLMMYACSTRVLSFRNLPRRPCAIISIFF